MAIVTRRPRPAPTFQYFEEWLEVVAGRTQSHLGSRERSRSRALAPRRARRAGVAEVRRPRAPRSRAFLGTTPPGRSSHPVDSPCRRCALARTPASIGCALRSMPWTRTVMPRTGRTTCRPTRVGALGQAGRPGREDDRRHRDTHRDVGARDRPAPSRGHTRRLSHSRSSTPRCRFASRAGADTTWSGSSHASPPMRSPARRSGRDTLEDLRATRRASRAIGATPNSAATSANCSTSRRSLASHPTRACRSRRSQTLAPSDFARVATAKLAPRVERPLLQVRSSTLHPGAISALGAIIPAAAHVAPSSRRGIEERHVESSRARDERRW